MTEELKQIRKLIVDGKFLEALNMIDLIMANSPQLENKLCICHPTIPPTFEEENKELVSKYNQLEKQYERTKETLFDEEERIKSLLEDKQELKQEVKTMENLRKMLEDERSRRCVLEDENNELKKLLLRCKDYLPEWITPMDILAEIDKLEEK